ncbi:hypothetical protein [Corynebacterium sp.]|uniref:hypothetical protein n=1 Tax=Corynebacterium sp. TaxID=1720 RepID=UPI0028A9B7EE|nr:hypothetical protein [Corynebacterium sp.]
MTLSPVSRRLKAGIAAVVVTPALVFAPTAVADSSQDAGTSADSSLPADLVSSLNGEKAGPFDALGSLGSIGGGEIGAAVTVVTALLDAGVSVGDIITIFMALQGAGVSISDIIAVFSFLADNPAALKTVFFLIEKGWITQILALIR